MWYRLLLVQEVCRRGEGRGRGRGKGGGEGGGEKGGGVLSAAGAPQLKQGSIPDGMGLLGSLMASMSLS